MKELMTGKSLKVLLCVAAAVSLAAVGIKGSLLKPADAATLYRARVASVKIVQGSDGYGNLVVQGSSVFSDRIVVEFAGGSPSGNTGFICKLDSLAPGPCTDFDFVAYSGFYDCGLSPHTVTMTAYDKSNFSVKPASASFSWTSYWFCGQGRQ